MNQPLNATGQETDPHRRDAEEAAEIVAGFHIRYTQFLNAGGEVARALPEFAEDPDTLIALYRTMVLTRTFDKRAIALQRTGRLGTYASSLGQEAIGAGAAHAMRTEDVLVPAYREYAAQFARGVMPAEILLYWGGSELGMNFRGPRRDFPICVPIGTQLPHAVGAAFAMKLRREARVAVCIFGDGATSKGDFYEAINAAGIWNLPVVFVVNNNQWAISMPRSAQTRAETLAQKAIAAGFKGEQVDGNDVIAVRFCVQRAIDKARAGGGPTLIEALTYRLCDHTTADDAGRYRSAEEVQHAWQSEPLRRLRRHLSAGGHWSGAKEQALNDACSAQVEEAVAEYSATPVQPPESMFDHLYASLPVALEPQRESARQKGRGGA